MRIRKVLIQLANEKPTKILVNAFLPKKIRRKWRNDYDEQKKEQVSKIWDFYIEDPNLDGVADLVIKNNNKIVGKKIIWQYWAQGFSNLPEIVRLCYSSVNKYSGDYEVIRLSDDNIRDYLIFPDFIYQKLSGGEVKPAHFSDLLRVALLYHYGGVWVDSTILLTAELPEQCATEDIFMFSRDFYSPFKEMWPESHFYFQWNSDALVQHLNSFMSAKKENQEMRLILGMLLSFWQKEKKFQHYFFFQILLQKLKEKKLALHDMPVVDDALPHLLVYFLEQAFDAKGYDDLMADINVHKLDWRLSPEKMTNSGELTYYGCIYRDLM